MEKAPDVDPIRSNRNAWNKDSRAYQEKHGGLLMEKALAWGIWRTPESELGLLDDYAGKAILELGCGAAQWSIALAREGADPVGLDISEEQLAHAVRLADSEGPRVPLVQASAHATPFRDSVFDIVLSDYGATNFVDPYLWVPEAARVLKKGGLLVFSTNSPLMLVCLDLEKDVMTETLQRPYFGMRLLEDDSEFFDYQLPHGEWIDLFRANGFAIERLVETQPAEGARSTFEDDWPLAWTRRWPAENIWKLRKGGQI